MAVTWTMEQEIGSLLVLSEVQWVEEQVISNITVDYVELLRWVEEQIISNITVGYVELLQWVEEQVISNIRVFYSPSTAPPEEYRLIQHTEYPLAKTYNGKAEECIFEFKLYPDQIPGGGWLGNKIANTFANEVAKENAEMLDLKIYEDTSPVWWTNYRVITTSTASPVPWALIIVAVLAILFVVALTFLIIEINKIDWGKLVGGTAVIGIIILASGIVLVLIGSAGIGVKKKELKKINLAR